jgi:hypothetical protein
MRTRKSKTVPPYIPIAFLSSPLVNKLSLYQPEALQLVELTLVYSEKS